MRNRTKRILALILAAVSVLNLAACGAAETPAQTTEAPTQPATVQTQPTEETSVPVAETTEPDILKGSLFLTVSSITFSVVGETEDIYLGVIPRELVSWESENPEIISVENGVLTAVGVGTTTIHASYEDRHVSCTAGCLAQDFEELDTLDMQILSQPKRIIPEVDMDEACAYFDSAALVGDSIAFGMMQHEAKNNGLGNIVFLARGGVSVIGFIKRVKNLNFQGAEVFLEDAIAKSGVNRVYFLMGSNDIAAEYDMTYMMDNWRIMLDMVQEKNPDVEIVLFSSIPKYELVPQYEYPNSYNTETLEHNAVLRQIAEEKGCFYLDLHAYIQDHWGRMPLEYRLDDTHLNELGCVEWMKIMRYYAQFEAEGGTL